MAASEERPGRAARRCFPGPSHHPMPRPARDFVGYGRRPPDPGWPGGARLALNFVINYEEGSEPSIDDGDGASEARLTEVAQSPVPAGTRDLAAESMFEYGARVGFWRLKRLFDERGLPFTLFACALALERNPAAAAAVRNDGIDVCCHGWRWIEAFRLTEDEEREHIRRAVESLRQTTGRRPEGWYCRYGPSVHTRRLLVEEGGFVYDSDAYNDELPYWVGVGDKPHLVVPYSLAHNDAKFASALATGGQFHEVLRDAIDFLRDEGKVTPRMMSVGLHLRLAGHPARAAGLARLLDHVRGCGDVWVSTRGEIARHWIRRHPP